MIRSRQCILLPQTSLLPTSSSKMRQEISYPPLRIPAAENLLRVHSVSLAWLCASGMSLFRKLTILWPYGALPSCCHSATGNTRTSPLNCVLIPVTTLVCYVSSAKKELAHWTTCAWTCFFVINCFTACTQIAFKNSVFPLMKMLLCLASIIWEFQKKRKEEHDISLSSFLIIPEGFKLSGCCKM